MWEKPLFFFIIEFHVFPYGGRARNFSKTQSLHGGRAWNFCTSQSLYGGEKLRIFASPKAYMGEEHGIFASPRASMGDKVRIFHVSIKPIWGKAWNFSKFQSLYGRRSSQFFQIPKPIWECQIQYIDMFLHIPSYFRLFPSYFRLFPSYFRRIISSYFPHIPSYLLHQRIPECDYIRGEGVYSES